MRGMHWAEIIRETIVITAFTLIAMVIVDFANALTKGRLRNLIKRGGFRQYLLTSFLGAVPGCFGPFLNVSFYLSGAISFGAVVGGMIAASGDEAFVMLAKFPRAAMLLFGILFLLGLISAPIADRLVKFSGVRLRREEKLQVAHDEEVPLLLPFREVLRGLFQQFHRRTLFVVSGGVLLALVVSGVLAKEDPLIDRVSLVVLGGFVAGIFATARWHYLEEHVWKHVILKHLWKVAAWTLAALILVEAGQAYFDLGSIVAKHMLAVLLVAGVIGLIPESGPHMIFVIMFAEGVIPFSVLLASSIVQDGHGMLPMFAMAPRDSLILKGYNLGVGLLVGCSVYLAGF